MLSPCAVGYAFALYGHWLCLVAVLAVFGLSSWCQLVVRLWSDVASFVVTVAGRQCCWLSVLIDNEMEV